MKLGLCASQEERSCELTLIVNYNSDKSFSSEVTYFVDFYSTTKSLVVLNLLLISPPYFVQVFTCLLTNFCFVQELL